MRNLSTKKPAIDIADPSSKQDIILCHMNFIIALAHCGVSEAQW